MGKMVEQEALNASIPVSKVIDNQDVLLASSFDKDEVAIEFTEPSVCIANIEILASKGVNIICGTTGWHADVGKVKR